MQKCSHVAVLQTPISLGLSILKTSPNLPFVTAPLLHQIRGTFVFWRCDKAACFLTVWQLTSDVRWHPLVSTHSLSTVFRLATPSLHAHSSNPGLTRRCARSHRAQTNRAFACWLWSGSVGSAGMSCIRLWASLIFWSALRHVTLVVTHPVACHSSSHCKYWPGAGEINYTISTTLTGVFKCVEVDVVDTGSLLIKHCHLWSSGLQELLDKTWKWSIL